MASNHKLTGVIKGRVITSTQSGAGTLTIGFSDGSTMAVQTAPSGSSSSVVTSAPIKAVRQEDTTLHLDYEDGHTWTITTAEPTSSVLVRDKNHTLEYAD